MERPRNEVSKWSTDPVDRTQSLTKRLALPTMDGW